MKKSLLVLVAILSFLICPRTYGKYGGGTGEPNDPYQIWTAEQMNEIGLHPEDWDKCFLLIADIDLSAYKGSQFNTIGRDMTFEGALDICLDTSTNIMYWTNYEEGKIQWANTNPIDYYDLVVIEPNKPRCIDIDHINGKLYWTSDKIQRSNLDGTDVEDVITTEVQNAYGIAVDGINGHIYWVEQSLDVIRRADMDGNNIVDLVVDNINSPYDVMLDVGNGFIYWSKRASRGGLYRAKLDGSEPNQIAYSCDVYNLAIDHINSKVYWTDDCHYWIKRANLDGTEVEEIFSPGYRSAGITLDTFNNKIYWTHSSIGSSIRRSNYDGSEIEILVPPQAFKGVFDGNNRCVYDFQYTCQDKNKVGIFEHVKSAAIIRNLRLVNPVVDANNGQFIGSLVGYMRSGLINNCIIENAYVTAKYDVGCLAGLNWADVNDCHISGIVTGVSTIGGIAGNCNSSNEMSSCSFNGDVTGSYNVGGLCGTYMGYLSESYTDCNVNGTGQVGGLVGSLNGGEILACFSSGNVNGQTNVGGLAGKNIGTLISSYSSAGVSGVNEIGGLAGTNENLITSCFAFGEVDDANNSGGLVGLGNPLDVEKSFWDINSSGLLTSAGGTGLSTNQMQSASTYSTIWSCEETQWTIDDGNDYPRLLWENRPGQLIERCSYGGGSGTIDDPYLINTAEQLNTIGLLSCDWTKHFKLNADIDMMELGDVNFNPIDSFHGVFDGNGHTIYNLSLVENGMFGTIYTDGVVKDLYLYNALLDANNAPQLGVLAKLNRGYVFACCGDVQVINGGNYTGGLVGINNNYGFILNSYIAGNIQGQDCIGGLVGDNDGLIRHCYSTANISGNQYVGGLIGYNNSIAKVVSSFWDVDISGEPNGIGYGAEGNVIGKTTAEMQDVSTFLNAGWDFVGEMINGPSDIWAESDTAGYMILWWQLDPNDLPPLPTFSDGNGTQHDPYILSTTSDINSIGHNPRLMNSHFLLIDDINIIGTDFHSIGNRAYTFEGVFDGNGHEVSNLNMERDWQKYVGFFGYTDSNCVIKNIGLVDANITTEKCQYVGGLGGFVANTTIRNCYFSGKVTGRRINSGSAGIGGLLGRSRSSTLNKCFSEGIVLGTGPYSYAGGLVNSFYDSNALDCFSTAFVTSYEQSGGLFSYCGLSSVENCYAAGPTEATYFNGEEGGLVGYNTNSDYKDCFWDTDTTSQSNALGNSTAVVATGISTAEMMTASPFVNAGWDFIDIWEIIEDYTYPYLQGLPIPKPFPAEVNSPEDDEISVPSDSEITWIAGIGATSHNVYFGQTNPPAFVVNQIDTSYSPFMDFDTTYYWRIDEVGPGGVTGGNVWTFRTIPWTGEGTEEAPYIIKNAGDLCKIVENPEKLGCHFKMIADIDLSASDFNGIDSFAGIFDGNNHTIYNYQIEASGENNIGFFKQSHGYIKNIVMYSPNIQAGTCDYVGVFAGQFYGTITNCHVVQGLITGDRIVGGIIGSGSTNIENCSVIGGQVSGNDYIGGLIGISSSNVNVKDCVTTCEVMGQNRVGGLIGSNGATVENCESSGDITGGEYAGGLIGLNGGIVKNSKAIGSVNSTSDDVGGFVGYNDSVIYSSCAYGNVVGNHNVGGFVGFNSSVINDCYAHGSVSGINYIGGFAGSSDYDYSDGPMSRCYSKGVVSGGTAGGFLGRNISGEPKMSYWDYQSSGITVSAGGIPKTTTQMQSADTFREWGCEQLWTINEGVDYPRLYWENLPGFPLDYGWFAGGTGTEEDPYLIDSAEQLHFIDTVPCLLWCSFRLISDIDLSSYDGQDGRPKFNIIGDVEEPFTGIFDGDAYRVVNFTYIDDTSDEVGLFGRTDRARIEDLGLISPLIDAGTSEKVGCIVGYLYRSEIENCYVDGGTVSGNRFIGGLIGINYYNSLIRNCWASADVEGATYVGGLVGNNSIADIYYSYATGSVTGNNRVGGLAGEHSYDNLVECFATGNVIGVGSSINFTGGLVGYADRSSNIENCYATGFVSGHYYVGGLIGCEDDDGRVYNCYSTGNVSGSSPIGGLIGLKDPDTTISNSFWDKESSEITTSQGGIGLTTAEMQDPNTFIDAGWDFIAERDNGTDDTWRLCSVGTQYPQLSWLFSDADFLCPDGVDAHELEEFSFQWLASQISNNTDFLRDSKVDMIDWAIFANAWQSTTTSPNWNPDCDIAPDGGDGKVNIEDMFLFCQSWLETGVYYLNADVAPSGDKDGIVNFLDFSVIAENWLAGISHN